MLATLPTACNGGCCGATAIIFDWLKDALCVVSMISSSSPFLLFILLTVGHGESGEGRCQGTQCLVLCLGRQSCFVMITEVVMGDVGVEENIFLRT